DAVETAPLREDPVTAETPAQVGSASSADARRALRVGEALEGAPAERLADHQGDAEQIPALLHDVVRGAELHRVHGDVLRSRTGYDHDGNVRMSGTHAAEAVETRRVREAVVHKHTVDASGRETLERLSDRRDGDDLEPSSRRERTGDQL